MSKMEQSKNEEFRTIRGYELAEGYENSLTTAMEDYLEMVGRLCADEGYTRVGKLSDHLQVKPSSASKMVRKLIELGYLKFDSNDNIRLTPVGKEQSGYLLHRHQVLERFLLLLGIQNPLQEIEMLEHSIKPYTVKRLERLLQFFEQNSQCRNCLQHYIFDETP